MLTVVILTRNEERHIARAIASVQAIADRVFIADSGSTDQTVAIAKELGAEVRFNAWRNYATQFNWALDQLPSDTEWILRLDADEIVTDPLRAQITDALQTLNSRVEGIVVSRRMTFLRRPIYHGGIFPIRVLRLFRHGSGHCEDRWMDEHIKVEGATVELRGEILDDNCNDLTWWTDKHNAYASREVIDLINLQEKFMQQETISDGNKSQASIKRWIKENIYAKLPTGLRPFLYFLYRYIFMLGFLDGFEGLAFHSLQGFWYRFLVDSKLHEVRTYMRKNKVDAPTAIRAVLKLEI